MSSQISSYVLDVNPIPINLTSKRVYVWSPQDVRFATNQADANGLGHFLLLGSASQNFAPFEILNPGNRLWARTDAVGTTLYVWEVFE